MIGDVGIQDILALAAVAACVAYTVRRMWRTLSNRSGCGCGQSRCPTTTKPEKDASPADDSLSLPVISDRSK